MSSSKLPLTGSKTAEVPVLRLRQAFWLFGVVCLGLADSF
jgi:hypothetical protein